MNISKEQFITINSESIAEHAVRTDGQGSFIVLFRKGEFLPALENYLSQDYDVVVDDILSMVRQLSNKSFALINRTLSRSEESHAGVAAIICPSGTLVGHLVVSSSEEGFQKAMSAMNKELEKLMEKAAASTSKR
jgi:hypothetical protein